MSALLYLDDLTPGIVTVRCDTCNQRGEVVQRLLARLMVMRRPVAI